MMHNARNALRRAMSNNANNRAASEIVATAQRQRRMEGMVAVVTGAGTYIPGLGNGMATAALLAMHGAKVALVDLKAERMDATVAMVSEHAGAENVVAIEADVATPEGCARVIDATTAAFGPTIDTLVNNVGRVGEMGRIESLTKEGFEQTLSQNVTSMMLMSQAVLPRMTMGTYAARSKSSIVNISSVRGMRGAVGLSGYCASKGAVDMLTETLALETGPRGIRVNSVRLGMVTTPLVDEAFGAVPGEASADEARKAAVLRELHEHRDAQLSLLARQGDSWDCAHAVLYLASEDARFVHGSKLNVDGGHALGADDETLFMP